VAADHESGAAAGCHAPEREPEPDDEPSHCQGTSLSRKAIRSANSHPITVQPVNSTMRKSPHAGQLELGCFQRRYAPINTGAK
jgi:hypothetical protein